MHIKFIGFDVTIFLNSLFSKVVDENLDLSEVDVVFLLSLLLWIRDMQNLDIFQSGALTPFKWSNGIEALDLQGRQLWTWFVTQTLQL